MGRDLKSIALKESVTLTYPFLLTPPLYPCNKKQFHAFSKHLSNFSIALRIAGQNSFLCGMERRCRMPEFDITHIINFL